MLKNASTHTSIAFALTHTVPIHEKLAENKLCLSFVCCLTWALRARRRRSESENRRQIDAQEH